MSGCVCVSLAVCVCVCVAVCVCACACVSFSGLWHVCAFARVRVCGVHVLVYR